MFTERLARWLARSSAIQGINQPEELSVILSSDVGLVRHENQDLIVAMRVNTPSSINKPFFVMALLDGMGGMLDGKRCAAIALSTFFYSLIRFRGEKLESRLRNATLEANAAVFSYAKGQGGTTLSAIIIEDGALPVTVNVGDSRIYSFTNNDKLITMSLDDSLEALGGSGRGLLQFIGMGESIKPHINTLTTNDKCIVLSSDGTHFISHEAFEEIFKYSSDFRVSAKRLSEYVRWCGAHDNASLGVVDCDDIKLNLAHHKDIGVELWDPHGCLHIMWMKNYPAAQNYFSQSIVDEPEKEHLNDPFMNNPTSNDKNPPSEINNGLEIKQGELFNDLSVKNVLPEKPAKKSRAKGKQRTRSKEEPSMMVEIQVGDDKNEQ